MRNMKEKYENKINVVVTKSEYLSNSVVSSIPFAFMTFTSPPTLLRRSFFSGMYNIVK